MKNAPMSRVFHAVLRPFVWAADHFPVFTTALLVAALLVLVHWLAGALGLI